MLTKLQQGADLLHSARAILMLAEGKAFELSEIIPEGTEGLSAVALSMEVANKILLDVLAAIDEAAGEIRRYQA